MFRSKKRELQENITKINIDILISLIPMLLVAFFVYEITPVLVILSAVIASELIEIIFSFLIQKNRDALKDFSGVVIGALTGKVYGAILNQYFAIPSEVIVHFMLLGMAAYFTAVVRAPITGITLILEMTGNFSYLYMLIIVCTITYIFTELLKMEPIYERLYFNMFQKQILEEDEKKRRMQKRFKRLEILEKWWKNKKIEIGIKPDEKNIKDKIVTLLIPVGANSEFDNKTVKELKLPENLLIVSVRKAGKDSIARGDTLIQSGNQLVIITDYTTAQKYAGELKEKGMKIVD